jgi:endonuclease YncB( thermonuclease family)
MLLKPITLVIFSTALAVFGRDEIGVATYTRDLEQEPVKGRCVAVTDGDTIRVLTANKQQIRVRLAFVDAPEKGQAFGQRAKQAMSDLAFGKDLELRPHTTDSYGRQVARIFIDNQDAGLELLKQVLCWVYQKYVTEAPPEIQISYRAAQAEAQSDKLGLWQDAAPVPPWEWRKEKLTSMQSASLL